MVTVVRGGIAPVRIKDKVSGYEVAVSSDGRLSVDASQTSGRILSLSAYNDNVAPGSPITILDYMVELTERLILTGVTIDGSANGVFEIFVNGDWIWRGQNSAANPTVQINFPGGFSAEPGDVLELKVKHVAAGLQKFSGALFANQSSI